MNEHGPSEWLALHRVDEGGVAKVAGIYLDHGYPVPDYLSGLFDRLTWAGLLQVADDDPVWDLRQLRLTDVAMAPSRSYTEYLNGQCTCPLISAWRPNMTRIEGYGPMALGRPIPA